MDNKNPLPRIDHGVDIIGDEWDEPEGEDVPELRLKYEKRHDPKHPYCTNWLVRKDKNVEDNSPDSFDGDIGVHNPDNV